MCLFVCLSVCPTFWVFLLIGLEKGSKEDSAISREMPSMSSDYRNEQYQDGNEMCEKSSAFDRIRDKTDSNMKVCRIVTQQDLANQILWWRSHRIQKGTCTWKNTIYDTIRHLHLEMSSIVQRNACAQVLHWSVTWFWYDWLKKNWNVAVLKLRFWTNHILWIV